MTAGRSRRRRGLRGLAGLGIAAAVAIAGVFPLAAVLPVPSAAADEVPGWPTTTMWADPSYTDLLGTNLTSTEATFGFDGELPIREDGEYPDYAYEVELRDDATDPQLVDSATLEAERSDNWIWTSWSPEEGTLELHEIYGLRFRAISGDDEGSWSDWSVINVVGLAGAPVLVAPLGNPWLPNPVMSASIPGFEYDPDYPAWMVFRVETGWEWDAPTTVAEQWVEVAEDGTATLPAYFASQYPMGGHFRWQAMWLGQGASEWTGFDEFTIAKKPAAPTRLEAYQDKHDLAVSWQAANQYTYVSASEYVVTLEPGGFTETLDAYHPNVRFTNVPEGQYTLSVTPRNPVGEGPPATKQVEMLATPPTAPVNLDVVVDKRDAEATWEAPADDGGRPVTGYSLTNYSYCGEPTEERTQAGTSANFTGLTAGCEYFLWVRGENEVGRGDAAARWFTAYDAASAPQDVQTKIGDGFIDVSWDQPEDDRGSWITDYVVTASPGGEQLTVPQRWTRQGVQFGELTNGVEYTFTVQAVNAAGPGDPATSIPATPMDGATDQDSDGLPDVVEIRFGTDVLLTDSDNDGLTDAQEVLQLTAFTSGTLADTDEDGVPDADEDSDGDGISNFDECEIGTNPAAPDSDHDSLPDADEVSGETDPTAADTDGDGVDDGFEVRVGLDPTEADSDGNGVDDGADEADVTLSAAQANYGPEEYGNEPDPIEEGFEVAPAEIEASGAVSVLQQLVVVDTPAESVVGALTSVGLVLSSEPDVDDAPAGPALRSASGTANATVSSLSMGYSASVAAGRLANLAPVRWNDATGTWEFVDNDVSVSTARRTISIDSPELGMSYAVVDLGAWGANATQCGRSAGAPAPLDVEVIMDATGSVTTADPTGERYEALRTVIGSLGDDARVSIRAFGVVGVIGSRMSGGGWNWLELSRNIYSRGISTDERYTVGLTGPEWAQLRINDLENDLAFYDIDDSEGNYGADAAESLFGGASDFDLDAEFAPATSPYLDPAVDVGCRAKAVVLVTDGQWQPLEDRESSEYAENLPEDWKSFRQSEIPVHVLDVGLGEPESSDWLIDLADDSGGTYSYVPTGGDLDNWVDEVTPPEADDSGDTTTDTDGDGIPDWTETHGITSTMTARGANQPFKYFSDPNSVDTDEDGLADGEEIGDKFSSGTHGAAWTSSTPITSYAVISNPREEDGDFDGLVDFEEIEVGMNALNADPDGDGLIDSLEEAYGTFAQMYDTDSDGFNDFYEVTHETDGFDPWQWNEPITGYEWLSEFALGMFCGDIDVCIRDTIPWMVGNIASGIAVFGDVRDGIAALFRGDVLSAAFCAVGLIPGIGDVAGAAAKVVKFIKRGTNVANKSSAMKMLSDFAGDSTKFLNHVNEFEPALLTKLRKPGMSDDALARILSKNDIGLLKKMVNSPRYKTVNYGSLEAPGFMTGGRAGENYMHRLLGIPGFKQSRTLVQLDDGRTVIRYVDGITGDCPACVFNESKVGYAASAFVLFQIRKDATAKLNGQTQKNVWHFFASGITGKIGPSPTVLKALEAAGIDFVVHFPS